MHDFASGNRDRIKARLERLAEAHVRSNPKLSPNRAREIAAAKLANRYRQEQSHIEDYVKGHDTPEVNDFYDRHVEAREKRNMIGTLQDLSGSRTMGLDLDDYPVGPHGAKPRPSAPAPPAGQPTPASGPSLRDQAAAHRATKGTLEDRLAPIRARVAEHRAVAGQHEAAIDKHGTVLDAFKRFVGKGKAPNTKQVGAAERAEAGKADARHEAFRAHAAANRIEQRVAKFKAQAPAPAAAPAPAPVAPAAPAAPSPVRHTAASIRTQAREYTHREMNSGNAPANSSPGDTEDRIRFAETALAKKHARDLPEDDFAKLMAGEGRKDMARGNAVRLVQDVAGVSKKAAEKALESIESTRQGSAHFARTGGSAYDKPTAGITKTFGFVPSDAVYRAAHRLATGSTVPAIAPAPTASPTPAPAPAPIDPATFGPRALAAAKSVGPEGRFMGGNKVFINHAHRAYESQHGPMPLDQFKAHLLKAQNSRHVDMSRADMVEAMNPTDVRESEIATNRDANGFGGSGFHFLRDDYTPPQAAPDDPATLDREHVEANKRIWATQAAYRDETSRAATDADRDALTERYRPRFAAHDAALAAIQARRAALAAKAPRPEHAPEVGRFEPTYDARTGGYWTGD